MCNIAGYFLTSKVNKKSKNLKIFINQVFEKLLLDGNERGRDSFGISAFSSGFKFNTDIQPNEFKSLPSGYLDFVFNNDVKCAISNNRAIPTTEYGGDKTRESQPFSDSRYYWFSVHNGTISNDKQLKKEFNLKTSTDVDSEVISKLCYEIGFENTIDKLKGSYSIAAYNLLEEKLYLSKNFKPLTLMKHDSHGIFIFSSFIKDKEELELFGFREIKFEPYSSIEIDNLGTYKVKKDNIQREKEKALVICSGGLDSTVSAKIAVDTHGAENVTLLHFMYGCNAESNEIKSINAISELLKVKTMFINIDWLKQLDDRCPLFNNEENIKSSVEGAEYCHEWVAARNTIFISIAASICDAKNFKTIYLGLNLEEGGAYPDNTVEFYQKFNKVLNLGTISRPIIENPLGNLVKHEIVKLAHEINAPIDLSWSCYKSGEIHCGNCGPCFMRRKAHEINGIKDSINYGENIND